MTAMAEIAGGLVEVPDLGRLLDDADVGPGARQTRLLATPVFEAWLVEWAATWSVGPHHHGDATVVVGVRRGRLRERRGVAAGHLMTRDLTVLVPGEVHELACAGAGPTQTVQVYSPPPTTATLYPEGCLCPARVPQ
ncbi:MAG TPA: hypothetical protein VKG43_05025 [Acidimicrobiales bacterium]|nr:hypothetical protein [Acidimicrobiales bacterium]